MTAGPPPEAQLLIRQYLSAAEERAWLDFLEIHATLVHKLDRQLTSEHQLPMRTFDLLMRIAHADDGVISVSELSEQVAISASQVSRLLIDLEQRGLVDRRPNAQDARSTCAAITERGTQTLANAAPTYLTTLREAFFDRLAPEHVEQLGATWRRILDDAAPPAD